MIKRKITIGGAGLVGSLLSIYLKKAGYDVTIFERRPDMRKSNISAGKSINLALSDRGILALKKIGILENVEPIAIPMHGRYIHNADGTEVFQPYGKEGQYINSVSRAGLNSMLMDLAEQEGVKIHFNHKIKSADWDSKSIQIEQNDGQVFNQNFDLLFGADGAFAATRLSQQLQHNHFQYQQFYIDYGYKELEIPSGENGSFRIEKNALHIWPRGNYMLIALPNIDGSFTCTLFFPFEGNPSFASIKTPEDATAFFKENFKDAYELMPTLVEDFFRNPTSGLVTVKCFPWVRDDSFALIGDAAHAIVPFFGQGMNCGFEDCFVLDQLLEKHNHNWNEVLREYQQLRKPDADAIAELALNNFVEMRDKVADKNFLLQKKIESNFSFKHPDKWTPAYSLVTFSPNISYSEALQKGNRQQAIMDEVMQLENIESIWNSEQIENEILKRLSDDKN